MKKRVPLKSTKLEIVMSWIYTLSCIVVWIFLIAGIFHLTAFYIYTVKNIGFYKEESVKISIYIIAGAFAFLFIYKDKVKNIFKIKEWKK